MIRAIYCLSLFIIYSFGFEFSHYNNINQLEKALQDLDIYKKTELEIITLLKDGRKKDAQFLFQLLKNNKNTQHLLENALLIPHGKTLIIVSKNQQKLIVLQNENNFYKKIFESPCITGKRQGDKLEAGDKKTPNGVYFLKYFIPQEQLSEIYGKGAFPLNYPNIIDKNIFHKTGSGIWIHATNNDKRKPFSSNGCIVLTNNNFLKLKKFIDIRQTPVVIVDDFAQIDPKKFEETKLSLGNFIYKWKHAWETSINGKVDKYLTFYSRHFVSPYGDFNAFKRYKKNIAQAKRWIKIKLRNVYLTKDGRVLDYGHIYVATFDMEYNSNNYRWSGKKILYIIKENGQWKILAEENL